jgi:hypothetical protein
MTNGSSIQFWSHPIGSQVGQSGWVRRQLKERLEMERYQKAMAVCPDGLTACIVPGAEQSFEVGPAADTRHKTTSRSPADVHASVHRPPVGAWYVVRV